LGRRDRGEGEVEENRRIEEEYNIIYNIIV
jgi:hypothetical protein